ncbi:hypothetical protein GGTG_10631 [Gaeumannomyces tritici R3-111a-1]|uniref:Cytochrome P450 n=1 Tax=Gaeumannomyces tritici (strain R3-111a-1) TaxID=644352 RepID=J3PAV6_GAET3|nr:hypothetical protein GGTG_10631 [Gaeumannomyces tritici R3-111a-1]EJT71372.1 hypothetical protein GGTG_10631 [Gaeumannomyces tritici R3-111a-1]
MGVVSLIPSLQLGAVLLAGIAIIGVFHTLCLSRLHRFPGPVAAKFTNAYRAFRTWMGRIDLEHHAWHRTYGSAVRIGPNTVMLNDPEMIRVVFTTKDIWQKSEMYRPNEALVDGKRIPNMFNTTDEAYHTAANKPVKPLYSLSRVQEVEPLVDESLEYLMKKFDAQYTDKGVVCMWDDWMAWWAWDTMVNITYGEHMGFMDKQGDIANFIHASTVGQYYYSAISQIPWLDDWLDKNPIVRIGPPQVSTGIGVTYMKLVEYMQKKAAAKASPDGGSGSGRAETYVDKFLRLKETHPDIVDDNHVFQYSLFNMLAGGDSTASLLRAAVYHLAKNPACYALLQAELDAAALPSLPARFRDVSGLTYLTAVVRETMRVNPGVSQTIERIVPREGLTLPDGRFVPAGARAAMDPSVIMKNEPIFGPEDVMGFHPERWLRRAGESDDGFDARSRKMVSTLDFIFGHGKRMCTGRHLAWMEIYKFLATMYSVYDIKLKDAQHEWKYRAAWFVFQTDMPMLITRRKST